MIINNTIALPIVIQNLYREDPSRWLKKEKEIKEKKGYELSKE